MMHPSATVSVLLLVLAPALALGPERPAGPYHERVGVPEAARLRHAEHALVLRGGRIVGGALSPAGTYPFMVGVVISLESGLTSVCGASMLSGTRALTAAHCWFDGRQQARRFTLVFGSSMLFFGGTRVDTERVEVHAEYVPARLWNDIAIVSFDYVASTDFIQPVELPGEPLALTGAWVTATGYGRTSDGAAITMNQLQSHVSLQVISNMACWQVYGPFIVDSMLCTSGDGGRGACGGDSGGPLVLNADDGRRVLVGVTSFAAARGCQAGLPSGFSRVSAFLPWIRERL